MKKTLIAAAVALASLTAQAAGPFDLIPEGFVTGAPSLVVEYNYNRVNGTDFKNHYGYVGLVQPTAVGVFDFGLQGVENKGNGFQDRGNGWEVGYAYPVSYAGVRFSPRIAYGKMGNLQVNGSGPGVDARYYLASIEATRPIVENIGGYVAFSHMNDVNQHSVARANRYQVGLDFTVTPQLGVRAGLSTNKFGDTRQNGVVLITSYSF